MKNLKIKNYNPRFIRESFSQEEIEMVMYDSINVSTLKAENLEIVYNESDISENEILEILNGIEHDTYVGLELNKKINKQVRAKIAERYDIIDEIEMQNRHNLNPEDEEWEAYKEYRQECIDWGKSAKEEVLKDGK